MAEKTFDSSGKVKVPPTAPAPHTHAEADITNLVTDLADKVPSARSIGTQDSLVGGGDLSADRTLSLENDEAAPGNNQVYGTDGSGARGWKPDPVGGGGATPTGTGFRHVAGGVEDAAAKLVENADVAAAAGIIENKLALNFPTHSNGLDHSNANDPTMGEKEALVGSFGSPDTFNVYVTDTDPRNTDARTPTAHSHPQSDVTNLVTDLAAKVPTTRTISTTAPLTGGGDLSADRTLAISDATTSAKGAVELATDGEVAANVVVQGNDARLAKAAGPTLARVPTADVVNSSQTTFTNLFTQAILASEVWSFEATVYFFSAIATTGITLQVDGPAALTYSQTTLAVNESVTTWRTISGPTGTLLTGLGSGLANICVGFLSGTIENGANAGNIVIKFRSEVNTSAVTVKRGSWAKFLKHTT